MQQGPDSHSRATETDTHQSRRAMGRALTVFRLHVNPRECITDTGSVGWSSGWDCVAWWRMWTHVCGLGKRVHATTRRRASSDDGTEFDICMGRPQTVQYELWIQRDGGGINSDHLVRHQHHYSRPYRLRHCYYDVTLPQTGVSCWNAIVRERHAPCSAFVRSFAECSAGRAPRRCSLPLPASPAASQLISRS